MERQPRRASGVRSPPAPLQRGAQQRLLAVAPPVPPGGRQRQAYSVGVYQRGCRRRRAWLPPAAAWRRAVRSWQRSRECASAACVRAVRGVRACRLHAAAVEERTSRTTTP